MTGERNYRKFTVTNPQRGAWFYVRDSYEAYAKTYKGAMEQIDRLYVNYDKAIATLAEMGEEPTESADIIRYRKLKIEFTRAQDKVASSSGMQSASLSLWHDNNLADEQAKADAMLEYRKECIAELERIMNLIRNLPTDIAEQEKALSTIEFRFSDAKYQTGRMKFLAY